MMYPYMILADETEIVHSQIIEKDGMKKVIVNFERPTEGGFGNSIIFIRKKLTLSATFDNICKMFGDQRP